MNTREDRTKHQGPETSHRNRFAGSGHFEDQTEQHRAAFERSSVGIAHLSPDGVFIHVNRRYGDHFGCSPDQLIGTGIHELICPEDLERFRNDFDRVSSGAGSGLLKHRMVRRDDRIVAVNQMISAVEGASEGAPSFFTATVIQTREPVESEADQRERGFCDRVPLVYQSLDEEGRIVDVNRSWLELFGYDRDEVIGKWFGDLPAPEYIHVFVEDFARCRESGEARDIEFEMLRKDGSRIMVSLNGRAEYDDRGNFIRTHCVMHDITGLKEAQEALRRSEAKYRNIFEHGVIGIFQSNPEGQYISVNPALARMLGYDSPEDLKGRIHNIGEQIYAFPGDRAEILRKTLESDGTVRFESVLVRKDGSRIKVNQNFRLVRDEQGVPAYMEGFVEDITERERMAEAVRASEARYRSLFEEAPVSLWEEDFSEVKKFLDDLRASGVRDLREYFDSRPDELMRCIRLAKVVDVNKTTVELYGAESVEDFLVGLERIFCEESYEGFKETLIAVAEGKTRLEREAVNATFSGERRDLTLRFSITPGSEDTLSRVLVSIVDITDVKRANEALLESEARVRSLYSMIRMICDNVPDLIWAKDLEGRFIFTNTAMREKLLNARDADEPLGKSDRHFAERERGSHPENSEWHTFGDGRVESDSVVLKSRSAERFDEFGNVKGRFLFLDVSKAPLWDESGNIIGTVGCARDVTGQRLMEEAGRRAEAALRRSEARYKELAESITDVFFALDRELAFTYLNRVSEEFMGIPADGSLGKPFFEVFPELSGSRVEDLFREVTQTRSPGRVLHECAAPDRRLYLEFGAYPSKEGLTVFVRDNTEHMRAQAEKVRLEAQLYRAQKMEALGTLAGGVAHDFNNILAAIIGYTEMAQAGLPEWSPIRYDLQQVLKSSQRAKELVKQILVFSRQSRPQERRAIEVAPIVGESLKLLRATLPTTIEIRQNIECGREAVLANPTQIHQIIMNLCTNAAHAMRKAGGVLDVRLGLTDADSDEEGFPSGASGRAINLRVSDTGHGMDASIMDRIFDPYFTTKEVGEGSGLGLAVVHGIVKRLEGSITVHSEPGMGAVFEVSLPIAECAPEAGETRDEPLSKGKESILLVDDEKVLVAVAEKMLEHLGYRVVSATDSMEALEIFRGEPFRFDLVITDYTMPGMTGVDLAEEIQRIRPDVPIILSTGYSETVTAEKNGGATRFQGFVMKPFGLRELSETVRRVLDRG